jgi:hypothetical protein
VAARIGARRCTGSVTRLATRKSPASGRWLPGSRAAPRSGRCGVARARRNLLSKRLNGGQILGYVLAVTVEHPPSDIGAISTDEDVTTDFGPWIVVSARRVNAEFCDPRGYPTLLQAAQLVLPQCCGHWTHMEQGRTSALEMMALL